MRQRGEIRLAAGQEGEAIGDFDAWLKEHPGDPESSTLLVLRARARIAAGDTEGAKGDLTQALAAVEPGSPNAYVAKRMLDELNAKK